MSDSELGRRCACGCGQTVRLDWARGHNNRAKPPVGPPPAELDTVVGICARSHFCTEEAIASQRWAIAAASADLLAAKATRLAELCRGNG